MRIGIDAHSNPDIKMRAGSHSKISSGRASNEMRSRQDFKLLDLFCGEGLAAWGYWLSGRFSEIVGIDDNPEMKARYSFDFICADAMSSDYEFLSQFDFIHASPTCQGYSKQTPKDKRANHLRLIPATHLMLYASGKPYLIENVEGSSRDLRPNIVLNGHSVGLPIDRRRYFHASTLEKPIRKIRSSGASNHIHNSLNRATVIESMGLTVINPLALRRMTVDGMLQGIPPLMTKYIITRLFAHKIMVG